MSRLTALLASTALTALGTLRLGAQQPVVSPIDTSAKSGQVVLSAAADSTLRDLGKAMAALAVSVQEIVTQTANKPEVRLAAVQLAGKAVSVAQQTLNQNTSQIERILAEASKRIAELELSQRAKVAAKP